MEEPGRATTANADERLVRRFIGEVLVARRLEVAAELFSQDVVDHQAGGARHGVQELTKSVRGFLRAFPDLAIAVNVMAVVPPITMAWLSWHGTHEQSFLGVPATGRRVSAGCVSIFRSSGGRLAERWEFVDVSTRKQLGLPRPASPWSQLSSRDRPLLRVRW